jgi:hypothetical protein
VRARVAVRARSLRGRSRWGSGSGDSETAAEGLGVGLPWTPPVAALASVHHDHGKRNEENPEQLHGLSIGWTAREHDWPNG